MPTRSSLPNAQNYKSPNDFPCRSSTGMTSVSVKQVCDGRCVSARTKAATFLTFPCPEFNVLKRYNI